MISSNPAETEHDILPVIQNRWSGFSFADTPIEKEDVHRLLEAARWAASSFNEQPWYYIVGYKGDETYMKLAQCLLEGNAWAAESGVLMLSIAKLHFDRKHRENRHAMHDTGMADAHIYLQATEMDLTCHMMAGFVVEKTRELFNIPEYDFEPAAMIAIGHPGDDASLSEDLQKRAKEPRLRRNVQEMIWVPDVSANNHKVGDEKYSHGEGAE